MQKTGGAICDLGNVVIAYWLSTIDRTTFSTIDYNSIPEAPGAFEGLRSLSKMFGGNVTVCYKATDVAQQKILGWLEHHNFSERTQISMDRVVHSSNGRDKTSFIGQSTVSHRGTTLVIDDRLEVLNYFVGHVRSLFLFRPQPLEIERFNKNGTLSLVSIVQEWTDMEALCANKFGL